ncbi:MAG: AAA family ATPase [Actinobacteria bacterium]|nr:AAA family ATPase [Actinomycetota bacterium]
MGTTTLLAETSALLSRAGPNVIAVDLDMHRGDLHYRLDVPLSRGDYTIADLLPVLDEIDSRILGNALMKSPCGVFLLPSPSSASDADFIDWSHIRRLLPALAAECDYLLVDTPPAFNGVTRAAIDLVDSVVLVVTPEPACLGGARKALDEIRRQQCSPAEIILLVNRSRGNADPLPPSDIEAFLDLAPAAILSEDIPGCRKAENEGRLRVSVNSALSREMHAFITQLLKIRYRATIRRAATS